MFTLKTYINTISLFITALIGSFFISQIFSGYSPLVPYIYFAAYSGIVLFFANGFSGVREAAVRVFMFLLSPVSYYLIFAEYSLLTNILFLVLLIFVSEKYIDSNKSDIRFFISSFLFGIILYVNFSFIIIYLVYTLYFYRQSFPKIITSFILTSIVFLSLYYSGLLDNGEYTAAFRINLFLLYLPLWGKIILFLTTLYVGWIVADIQEVFFSSSILLLVSVVIFMIKQAQPMPDSVLVIFVLSALAFCSILLILSVKYYQVDRFLGKIMPVGNSESVKTIRH